MLYLSIIQPEGFSLVITSLSNVQKDVYDGFLNTLEID